MLKEKKYRVGIIVISIITLLFFITIFISNYIENKINDLINNSKSDKYVASVEVVDFKLFDRSIKFENIFISPKTTFLTDSLSQNRNDGALEKITISSVKINNIHFF